MWDVLELVLKMGAISTAISTLIMVFSMVCWWIIYGKVGLPGWHSLIPFYSTISLANQLGYPTLGIAICACVGGAFVISIIGMMLGGVLAFIFVLLSVVALFASAAGGFILQYKLIEALGRPTWFIILCIFVLPAYLGLMAFTD